MRGNSIKRILTKTTAFLLCFILAFGVSVDLGSLRTSDGNGVVQFGMDKVWGDNPWETWLSLYVGNPSKGWDYYDIAMNVATIYNRSGNVDRPSTINLPNVSYLNKLSYVKYRSYYSFQCLENITTYDLDFTKYNYKVEYYYVYNSSQFQWYTNSFTENTVLTSSQGFDVTFQSPAGITIYRQLRNQPPTITVTSPTSNTVYSEVSGYSTIPLRGTVSDPNTGDTIMTKYNIDGGTTQTVSGTVTTSGNFTNTDIPVSSLAEGSHNLNVWSQDNQGLVSPTTTIPFKMDRTAPTIGTVTLTSTTSNITIAGTATDAIAGLDPYPYKYTISGYSPTAWLTTSSYTSSTLPANTQYTATFEARDSKGHIASKQQSIYTKAQVPTASISNRTSYTLDVSVSDSNPTTTPYQIIVNSNQYVTPEGTLTSSPVWITLSSKKITVKGLSASTTYTFQVKAKNGDGVETALSTAVSGTTLVAPPVPPSNITATATDTSITVAWDAVAGAAGYDIEADGTVRDMGTSTRYTHPNLSPGTPHTYRLRARNEGGPGAWSTAISKSTLPSKPGIPANLSAVPLSTSITVTWNNVPGATGYDIEVDGVLVSNGPNTNYKHTSLTPGTSHTYRVRSVNSGDKSDWSSPISFMTLVDSTSVPVNINATALQNQITITWDPVDGATGYDIEVDGVRIDNNNRTTYTHKNLTSGTDHMYRVRAKKGSVVSDWSAMVVATTLTGSFGTPANIKADVQDTNVTLSWDAVTDAQGYDVEVDGEPYDNGADITFVQGGLLPGTEHNYRVRARSSSETSDWSAPLTVKTFMLPTPRNFSATATESSIQTVWDAVYGADSYSLELDGSIIPDITDTSYTLEGLAKDTQHTLRVRAESNIGKSNWSTPLIQSISSNISGVPVLSGIVKKNAITVIWKPIDGALGYDMEADGVLIENVPGTSYVHSSLAAGTDHTYKVRARYEADQGSWSNVFSISTLAERPAIPTNVAASSNMTSILVTWDKAADVESYEIEVDGVAVDNGIGTSYLHNMLSPDTQHSYKVRAKNKDGYSDWSNVIEKKTVSSVQTFEMDCAAVDEFSLALSAANIQDLGEYTFTVKYDPEELDVTDLCGFTSRIDLGTGSITGTDIKIVQFEPGTIVFTKAGYGQSFEVWSGIVDSIKMKAKKNGRMVITYSIN